MNSAKTKIDVKLDDVIFWKGVAIFMIILTHSHQIFSLPIQMRLIPMFGQMGCQIFFVLSCFGLCLSYERKVPGYLEFFKKRIKSISIGYWLSIIVSLLLAAISIIVARKNIFLTCTDPIKVLENIVFVHGLDPSGVANNKVVRGGWFIGTLVLLYLLFPLLWRLHSKIRNKDVLPIIVFSVSFLFFMFLYSIDNSYMVSRGTFLYFSFVNQLPSFVVGFVLFDWKNSDSPSSKCSLVKGLAILMISFVLFYIPSPFTYIIVPFVFSLSFSIIYRNTPMKIMKRIPRIYSCMLSYGKYSYAIYLLHPYLAFELSSLLISLIRIPEWLLYLLWLPILYMLIFVTGKVYNSAIESIRMRVYLN